MPPSPPRGRGRELNPPLPSPPWGRGAGVRGFIRHCILQSSIGLTLIMKPLKFAAALFVLGPQLLGDRIL